MYCYSFMRDNKVEDEIYFNEKKNADKYAADHMYAQANINPRLALRVIRVDGCMEVNLADQTIAVWVQEVNDADVHVNALDQVDESADVWVA